MVNPDSVSTEIETLNSLVKSCISLVDRLRTSIEAITRVKRNYTLGASTDPGATETSHSQLNPLELARDSATLIRAHATKISLLIINEPFTPSALNRVLRELSATPIPSLASAVQACNPRIYTTDVQWDLASRCEKILRQLKPLLQAIPKNGQVLPLEAREGIHGKVEKRGSITITGVLWAACDELIKHCNGGLGGMLTWAVDSHMSTLEDVMEELKEWEEEASRENDDDDDDDAESDAGSHSDVVSSVLSHQAPGNNSGSALGHVTSSTAQAIIDAQAMVDEFMNAPPAPIAPGDPLRLRPRLESTMRRLRLVTLLYKAVIRRRIKTLPPAPITTDVSRLNEAMRLMSGLPDRFGDLANEFYEQDIQSLDRTMDTCFLDAFAIAEILKKPWIGEKDEFTQWASNFQDQIRKPITLAP